MPRLRPSRDGLVQAAPSNVRKLVSSGSPYEPKANTIMQVSRFIDPEWLIEFEADAVVDDESAA